MKVDVFNLQGKPTGKVELPRIFKEQLRSDLIKRTVLALQSQGRQPYGSDPMAGKRTSAHYHGKRKKRFTMMNIGKSRLPRLHGSSPHLMYRARRVPRAVKGRRAHPPKVEKIWSKKINKKEERMALRSAIAATANKEIIESRGHKINGIKQIPLVINDNIQSIKKTKEVEKILISLGLEKELERSGKKKVRAGKGKMRGRKYKKKRGPLIIISEDKGIIKAGNNIAGVNVCDVKNVSVEDLAPGALPGRITIYSKSAVEELRGF